MKYNIVATGKFKKDLKTIVKRGYDINLLTNVVDILEIGGKLPERFCDHALSGKFVNHRECHLAPDWLLIYRIHNDILVLALTRTGSHSDIL